MNSRQPLFEMFNGVSDTTDPIEYLVEMDMSIPTDNGDNLWIDKGSAAILIPGAYLFSKHGETKTVAGGTIEGWKTLNDVYDFFRNNNLSLQRGFQSVAIPAGSMKDTVIKLSDSEVAALTTNDLGLSDKNNFSVDGLPPNKAPIIRRGSSPAEELQILMFPTTAEYMETSADYSNSPQAIETAKQLEAQGKSLWVVVTLFPGKSAPSGNRDDKNGWLHPTPEGLRGNYAFSIDSVKTLEPWPAQAIHMNSKPMFEMFNGVSDTTDPIEYLVEMDMPPPPPTMTQPPAQVASPSPVQGTGILQKLPGGGEFGTQDGVLYAKARVPGNVGIILARETAKTQHRNLTAKMRELGNTSIPSFEQFYDVVQKELRAGGYLKGTEGGFIATIPTAKWDALYQKCLSATFK